MAHKSRLGRWSPDLFREPNGGYRFFIAVGVGAVIAVYGLTGLFGTGQEYFLFFLGSFLATLGLAEIPPTDRTRDAGALRVTAIFCLVMGVIVFLA